MIVDCHTHIWRREHWSDEMARESARARSAPAVLDIEPEVHWRAVQAVDKAIVFGLYTLHLGLLVPNDFVAAYVAQHPDKLIGFACVDPNQPHYLEELQRSVTDLKMRGLKLGPIYQNYHPMDPRMLPVYEYCQRNRLPILIHQGTTFPRRAPLKFACPLQLEDVALAYPDLVMIIAHLGHPWIDETLILIRKQPNFYADISALYYRPWQFYNGLIMAMEYGVADKLLFGSDFPFTTPQDSINGLRAVNHVIGESGLPKVSQAVIEGMLERDTLSILGLK
ncbi:MAG: amidohydrolase family protein [Terriglobales bacterium]